METALEKTGEETFFAKNKKTIFWIITVITPLLIMMLPTGELFNPQVRLFVAVTACGILLFAFESLPQLVSSIMLPLAYVLIGLAPSKAIFVPWATVIPWMFMGGILGYIRVSQKATGMACPGI
ncbi:hypothetical protein KKI24_00500 [bacterium]|nr:hypothetical protein [bacterium]